MTFRETLNLLPIVYVDKDNLEKDENGKIKKWPIMPCWVQCFYYTWDMDRKDFVLDQAPFWFDGENFHQTQDLYNADNSDWICEIIKPAVLL